MRALFAFGLVSFVAASFPWFNTSLSTLERAEALVAALTVEEKAPQLSVDTPALPRLGVKSYHFRSNVLHGTVSNGVATVFPQAIGMGATFSTGLLHDVGRAISDEQRAKHNIAVNASATGGSPMDYGLDVWGPNINGFVHPQWGRGQETYGEDPTLTSRLATAFVDGLQRGPVDGILQLLATAKHFDAYSVDKEPPRLSFMPNISEADLRQYYFPAFESLVKAGIGSIMCSYNGISATLSDPTLSVRAPMCANPLLKRVLREEWGFGADPTNASAPDAFGYIVTDSGALEFMVSEFHAFNETYQAAAAAMAQGVDLNSGTVYANDLPKALSAGLVTEAQLDVALTRLFVARIRMGLFDPPTPYDNLGASVINSPAHRNLSRKVAQASFVLLKNENLLPLNLSALRTVGVVGPAANDTYRLVGNYAPCTMGAWDPLLPACNFSTPLHALETRLSAAGVRVAFEQGCAQESNDTSGFAAAVEVAKASDVVVAVMGIRNCQGGQGEGGAHCISEGHDRPDLQLPGVQNALLQALQATGTPVVLVLMDGGPVAINWAAANMGAILETFYGGVLAGEALVDVLVGDVAPSARLPFTMYTGMEQVPSELGMGLTDGPGRTYRYLNSTPLYAFGYGLGYSAVTFASMSVTPAKLPATSPLNASLTVCGDVENVGSYHQDAVVQAYATLTSPTGLATAPKVALVGFSRSGTLPPGGKAHVCIDVDVAALRLVDNGGVFGLHSGWMFELSFGTTKPGPLGLNVPRSAVQAPLVAPFAIV